VLAAVSTMSALYMDVTVRSPASKKHIETASGTAERVPKNQISGLVLDAEYNSKVLFMVDTIARHANRQPTESVSSARTKWRL